MTQETYETKQFHRKNLGGLGHINPEVNKFTARLRFTVRITLFFVNLTIVIELRSISHKHL